MRVPQRLQIVARCWVFLTGTFLNMVASNSFIFCSLEWMRQGQSNRGATRPQYSVKEQKTNAFR
jgi:hypothetical protein